MWAVLFALAMAVVAPAARGADDVPTPQPRPVRPGDPPDATPRESEAKKGAKSAEGEKGAKDEAGLPDAGEVPRPEPRPDQPGETKAEDEPPADAGKEEPSLMPPPRPAEMPAEETACRARLKELGVAFEERPQLADAAGCSVPWPIAVSALSKDVALAPEAVMNCATAQRAAEFARDHIAPKASAVLGSALTSIRQDSAYVCRPRNGSAKLSEHAFGNALDIGAFLLKDGRTVEVGKASKRGEGEFMLAIRLAACGPFTTVLGPGSDADHASHFHFDLAARRKGSAFCQ